MVIIYALRNLYRNKRRTFITLAALTLNTAILITGYALMDGLIQHTVRNATNIVVGKAQIHAPGYLDDHSFYKSIKNPEAVFEIAKTFRIGAARRSYGYGLISVGIKSTGTLFWGIDPIIEQQTFDLARHIQTGKFLSAKHVKGIVLGRKLASSLDVSVGTEVIALVQSADGSLGNDLFIVTGILKSIGESVDRGAAILHEKDFQELFISDGRVHEIALNMHGKLPMEDFIAALKKSTLDVDIKTWQESLPGLSDLIAIFDTTIWIFGIIFFLATGLGIMNSMLMATYERMNEFGILNALGTTPRRIIAFVAIEAFILSFMGTLIGTAFGLSGSIFLQKIGIDTSIFASGFTVSGFAFDPIWRAALSVKVVLLPVALTWIVCTAASLYPAVLAARMDPVQAIHHT